MFELYNAAQNGDLELVKSFIREEVNVNEANEFGDTPLNIACYLGHIEIAKLLLVNEANIHAEDNNGLSVLHSACNNGNVEIIRLLLAKGAKINAVSSVSGATPLHCACLGLPPNFVRNIEAVKLLIEKGADVNAINNRQAKPLAIANRNVELVKLLIPHMLIKDATQEKPDCLKNKDELSLFWDEQSKKINFLLKALPYQLKEAIFNKITSEQKDLTLSRLVFQFFKPPTIEPNILEANKTTSKLAYLAESSRCIIL